MIGAWKCNFTPFKKNDGPNKRQTNVVGFMKVRHPITKDAHVSPVLYYFSPANLEDILANLEDVHTNLEDILANFEVMLANLENLEIILANHEE